VLSRKPILTPDHSFTKGKKVQGMVICVYLSAKQLCHKRHSAAMIAGV
jgi:hypothetical protein